MNYKETIEFLFGQLAMYQRVGKVAYKANLDNSMKLDAYLNYPHRSFKTIHVAGTNGKGSVSHSLASVLSESGLKVGLYTSPHLKDFRERIKVNGECIGEQDVVDFVKAHKGIIEEVMPSFFEMTVAMAFDHFRSKDVDVAVIEVGLGGRLDSTNIIIPELSVITNIGLDHVAILGANLGLIAKEKAGVIKQGVPVVVGETQQETQLIFEAISAENDSELVFADQLLKIGLSMVSVNERQIFQVDNSVGECVYKDLEYDLLGLYQHKNIITILVALDVLKKRGFEITEKQIRSGLSNVVRNTGLLGRWQYLGYNPRIICDTGHNVEGVSYVVEQIKQTPYQNLHVVWGMVSDKSHKEVLELLPRNATYYFTQASMERSLPCEMLLAEAKKVGLAGEVYKNSQDALKNAKKNAGVNDLIFIGGSTFLVAELI